MNSSPNEGLDNRGGRKMEPWMVAVLIFGATQLGSLLWTLATMRGDSRVTQTQLEAMQKEITAQGKVLERQATVMETLAVQRQDIALMQERLLLQGRRLDRLDERMSALLDGRAGGDN